MNVTVTLTPIALALLPLLGVVVGAVITGAFLITNNRMTIKAAREREQAERDHRSRERRAERLHEIVSELLGCTDSDGNLIMDRKKVVTLVTRAQLLLDFKVPAEGQLNDALNRLAIAADQHVPERFEPELARVRLNLLNAHSDIIDRAKALVQ